MPGRDPRREGAPRPVRGRPLRPRPREMFSPGFPADAAAGAYPDWWADGDLIHHRHTDGTHYIWRLGRVDPGTRWIEGVWPD